MKAVVCPKLDDFGAISVTDTPEPSPGESQALVEVHAASLNFPDVLMARGLYQVKPPVPFIPGTELCGVVRSVGSAVQGFSPGDRVFGFAGHGGFAELCAVDTARLMKLPDGIGFEDGAAFGLTYGTALHALRDCGLLAPGETLAVLGASGGTGIAAIECGKAIGATVIACASSDRKLELCRAHGADHTVNYATEDLRVRLDAITGKRGVDVVFDPVGGPYTEPAFRAAAWRGRLLVIGFAAGDIPKLALNLALLKERSIVGVYWGDWTRREPAKHAANMADLARWIREGVVRPAITEKIGLAEVPKALERMARREVLGKVIVVPR
ncbi:MAG TPA: NADPH:quinone oxidoreductase family protein [Usitatibacter sp.]|jgi:NADPH2:quinone reductase|nr:NADPH:quinone oxidoreductase family protein [Usitatibacter sp.]